MKKLMLLLFILQVKYNSQAQNISNVQTPCTTSAEGKAGNFIISYTIGEMPLIQSWKTNGLMITQGVLQPVPFIADTVYQCFSQTEVKVYPNPTPGIFSLQLSILKKGKVQTVLFDATGRQIQADAFDYNTFSSKQYDIARLSKGVYYLQLFFKPEGSNDLKKCVYTIQKNN
jgi:Secretion system C-terminal sorting domain